VSGATHTPGPWRWLSHSVLAGDHGTRPVVLATRTNRDGSTANLDQRNERGVLVAFDPASPDGMLLAAAPDLASACDAMLSALTDTGQATLHEVGPVAEAVAMARAALAKAGRQP